MENKPETCFIYEQDKKEKFVVDFSNAFYNQNLSISTIKELSEKIAKYAMMIAAYVDGHIAGFIAYYRNDSQNRTAFITLVVLDVKYRGMGVGTLLLKKAIDDCMDNGYTKIRLEVDNGNTIAINLYKKMGFKEEKVISEYTTYYSLEL